jgi:hypothetical protein
MSGSQTPIDDELLEEMGSALEAAARRSTNGEAAKLAILAGDLAAARARYAALSRITPAKADGSRPPLPPEEREA